jgi:hypothetical protein
MKEICNILGKLGVGQKQNKNIVRLRAQSKVTFQLLNLL